MSSQSLRELLEAELAALSDCDDAELTDKDSDLYATSYDGTVAGEDGLFSRDVTDETKSLDEWQLLIQSSEQAERRFQGMRFSLNDDLSCPGEGQRVEVEPAIGLPSQTSSIHDPSIFWCPNNLNVTSVEDNLRPACVLHVVECCEGQEDGELRTEVIELLNSMIEAVLRSAPITRAPLLQFKSIPQAIDWSSLPQILQDEDTFYDAVSSSSSSSDLNLATDITYDDGDDEQSKIIIERKIQLKIAEDNLLLISNKASEIALQRKVELVERRRRMEEELGQYKREKSSVLIQSKWRQHRQICAFLIQLDFHRKKTVAEKLAKARVTEEKKKQEFQEKLRLKALHEKMIAQEMAAKEEEERVEEMMRVAEELAVLQAKEIEVQAQVQVEVERIRKALEEERRREELEMKTMQIMESESRIAWDLQKRIEDSCVLCKECFVVPLHRHVIRIRRRRATALNAMHFEEIMHSDEVCKATKGNVVAEEESGEGADEVEQIRAVKGEGIDDGKREIEEEEEQQPPKSPVKLMETSDKALVCLPERTSFDDMHQPQTQTQTQTQAQDVLQELQPESRVLCISYVSGTEGRTLHTQSGGENASRDSCLPSNGVEHASLIHFSEDAVNIPSSDCSLLALWEEAEVEIVPPGVVRLQAVWRGRKARMRIKSALLAARYQDDELDDLLGYEELDMDDALLGYEEYLAPISLRGGWQPSLPYPEQTENLHGTRMVKALAGGWVAGGLECTKEDFEKRFEREGDYDCREIPSSHTIAGPLVYGDHRRRRQSQKEGQLEPLHNYHSFSDGPHTRSSPLGGSPRRDSSSSSSPRIGSTGWSNQRPQTACTETSILSESSAGVLPVLNPSLIIRDEDLTAAKVSPVQRVNRNPVSGVRHKSQAYNVSNTSSSVDNRETAMSRGGGGAAGMSSSTGSGRGRGGMGRGGGRHKTGRKAVPPAWALTGPPHGGEGDEY